MIEKEEIIELRVTSFTSTLLNKIEKLRFVKKAYFIEEVERIRILLDDIDNFTLISLFIGYLIFKWAESRAMLIGI